MVKKLQKPFPIAGIGASAGGLEALEQFFANMPSDKGIAFVIIQHLDPTQPGNMPELIQRFTSMQVIEATDRLRVNPDCVYIIPSNTSLSIKNGILQLKEPVEARGLRLPIDIFFRSLAEDQKNRSIGIVLSGMGSDGSLGIKSIKEKNGIVLVQDPTDAKFDSMPRHTLQTVRADIVTNAGDLPSKLIGLLKYTPQDRPKESNDTRIKSNLDKIILLLYEHNAHDFSQYKPNTLFRRIERRKGIHHIHKIQDYVRYLQENPSEVEILFNELLIGVTSFFRDAELWKLLKENILPQMIKRFPEGYVFRAWIPACSTGEEAYSLAIVFQEIIESLPNHRNYGIQIFASDIDPGAIEKARKGFYSSNISNEVAPERIKRFFSPEADGFRIKIFIREMVVFAVHNVIKDPPFTKLDILSCRNMLIYMEQELQKKVFNLFHYSLNTDGILILGSSESLGNLKNSFIDLDTKLKVFQRSGREVPYELINFSRLSNNSSTMNAQKNKTFKTADNTQTVVDNILIQRFTPPSVLVNENGDIIYITGRTGKYLEPVAGKANWNIYAMARDGLKQELPPAFRKVMQHSEEVHLPDIKIEVNGSIQIVDVTMQRLKSPEPVKGLIIIIFKDAGAYQEVKTIQIKGEGKSNSIQKKLQTELKQSYEELQKTREEMQTSQEELRSTNEELQSANEELQSTNEELTTSKEEMQSLNEELQTVNIELQNKVNDLVQTNSDMKNLLNSTEIATLFLDKELNVRRFTDTLIQLFKLRTTDIGRPFTDVVNDLLYPEIENDAKKVLKSLTSIETSITTTSGKWFSIRIMPYRTIDDHIDGLVLTFSDITQYMQMEMELNQLKRKHTSEQ